MRSIVFAVALSACYHYALERAPQPTAAPPPDTAQLPSVAITASCFELARDQMPVGPRAVYVTCSDQDPETTARTHE
jgi:hypothetical protein